jgi:hypothetical protein
VRSTVRTVGAVALTTAALAMSLAGAAGIAAAGDSAALVTPGAAGVGVGVASTVAVGYVATREARSAPADDEADGGAPDAGRSVVGRTDAARAAAVALAAPVTRWLAVDAGLGVVVAAALVGLCAALIVPDYAAAAYCGSFVGMATPGVLPGYAPVFVAGVAGGVTLVAVDGRFDGMGGKLGTTAFVGCVTVAVVGRTGPWLGAAPTAILMPTAPAAGAAGPVVVAASVAGAVATFVASVRLGHGPVVGSAVVGLVGGLLAPALSTGGVAAAVFCASFAGMAAPDRLPNEVATGVAGLASGVLLVGVDRYFVGFGGKLGTVAFVGCLLTCGLLSAAETVAPTRTWTRAG